MAPIIQRVVEVEDIKFGEGPHWDISSQSLYFVDFHSKTINRYVPATKSHFKANLENYASFIIPIEGQKNKFVIGVNRDIAIITWDGEKESVDEINNISEVGNALVANVLNDGKCDVLGRLWTGTLQPRPEDIPPNKTTVGADKTEPVDTRGSFYSYGGGTLKKHFDQVAISNGIAWNKDNTKIFYIDSMRESVDQFDFDLQSGEISNRKVLFSLKKHQIEGGPDGMTIDENDNLWVAIMGGNKVIKISSSVPESLLDTITLPAQQVTSAAWGGEHLDELYVTTARFGPPGIALSAPTNGSLYKITGLGARGSRMNNFKF